MALSYSNFSFDHLSTQFENRLVTDLISFDDYDKSLDFQYKFTYDKLRLLQQANVFAQSLVSLTFEKRYVFGPQDRLWIERAEKCYIYSYFKCLFHGLFRLESKDIDSVYVFAGHALFQQLIRVGSISTQSKRNTNLNIYHTLEKDFIINEEFLKQITKDFDFIKIKEMEVGRFQVFSTLVENWLARLNEQNLEKFITLIDLKKDTSIATYTTWDKTPLGNSCYLINPTTVTRERNKFLFLLKPGTTLENNQNLWFAIANFIYIVDDKVDYGKQSHYQNFDCSKKDYRLVKYEMHSNTYFRTSKTPDMTEFKPTTPKTE